MTITNKISSILQMRRSEILQEHEIAPRDLQQFHYIRFLVFPLQQYDVKYRSIVFIINIYVLMLIYGWYFILLFLAPSVARFFVDMQEFIEIIFIKRKIHYVCICTFSQSLKRCLTNETCCSLCCLGFDRLKIFLTFKTPSVALKTMILCTSSKYTLVFF